MKKNITINLCGRLFQIDEDAYEMLQHYMDSLRSYFGRQEGSEEIVNDIEARIAELFAELKTQGNEAITISHVKDIITRIGKPEQLADDTDGQETKSAFEKGMDSLRSRVAGRRLYRNPNDKILAGVLSGLAAYTGTDATFWRVGAVLLTFFYGSGILFYIILAIVIPEAKTPEELLRMEGREVNPKNLADMVVDGKDAKSPSNSGFREVLSVLLKIVFGFFIGLFVFVGVILGIVFFGILSTMAFVFVMPAKDIVALPFTLGGMGLSEVWSSHPAVLIVFALSLLMVIFVPLYAIVHMVLSMTRKVKSMSIAQRVTWIVLWIIALCCLVPSAVIVGMLHNEYRSDPVEIVDETVSMGEAVYDETDSIAIQQIDSLVQEEIK